MSSVERAAAAMWSVWGLGGNGPVGRTWDAEGDTIRDMWRSYARAALDAAMGTSSPARFQAAWDSVDSLPAIVFTEDEASRLLAAIGGDA